METSLFLINVFDYDMFYYYKALSTKVTRAKIYTRYKLKNDQDINIKSKISQYIHLDLSLKILFSTVFVISHDL